MTPVNPGRQEGKEATSAWDRRPESVRTKIIAEGDEQRKKSRERHARENMAIIAKQLGTNREFTRKAKFVMSNAPKLYERFCKGELKLPAIYSALKGDRRVGLYVKISRELHERLWEAAIERGMRFSDFLIETLTQIFGEQ